MENKPDKIIVHHTAVSDNNPQFARINIFHRDRKFPRSSLGYYVGYHWIIEKEAQVQRARLDKDEGAHTKGVNFSSIGIGMAGNFDIERPTKYQETILAALILDYMKIYKIPIWRVYPHRQFAIKSCYGTLLNNNWAQIIAIKYQTSLIKRQLWKIQSKLAQLLNA